MNAVSQTIDEGLSRVSWLAPPLFGRQGSGNCGDFWVGPKTSLTVTSSDKSPISSMFRAGFPRTALHNVTHSVWWPPRPSYSVDPFPMELRDTRPSSSPGLLQKFSSWKQWEKINVMYNSLKGVAANSRGEWTALTALSYCSIPLIIYSCFLKVIWTLVTTHAQSVMHL